MGWVHPNVGLSELVVQVGAFLDILILTSGYQSNGNPAVWSEGSLQKALDWASYFEQVMERLPEGEQGEASKRTLESAIEALLVAVPLPPGISPLSVQTLSNARIYVVQLFVQALRTWNAWLIASYVELSMGGDTDLWEVVIKGMAERCVAFGSADSLQKALDVAVQSGKSRAGELPKLEVWKNPSDLLGFKVSSTETWANKGLEYVTAADTIHKLTGATLIFSASQQEWTQVLDALQSHPHTKRPSGVKTEIAELCCLFLASSRWKELPSRLLNSTYNAFRDMNLLSSRKYRDCWVGKNSSQNGPCLESVSPQLREQVECYLQNLVGLEGCWDLAPVLLAAALTQSSVLELYLELLRQKIAEVSSCICSSDCSCQMCHQRAGSDFITELN